MKTAKDFDQGLLDLFDRYVHGAIDRREFLARAGKYAAAGVTAAGLLEMLSPKFAEAQQVPKDDKRLKCEYVQRGYLARPAASSASTAPKKLPAILVIHENRGLNPHIEDISRRLALENYLAFAPDALAPLGGYPGDEDKARELFQKLDQTKVQEDFVAAFSWLKKHEASTGKVGAVGFCFGGKIVNMLAVRVPELAAGVPFYGTQPEAADVPKIKAPLLIHYAEKDERVNAGAAAYEAALKAHKIAHTVHVYAGTQHGFNNDTTPRYDAAAAKLAWSRTLEFFAKHLRG